MIEYCGDAVRQMSMEERMTVCNMSIECGARAGLVSPDWTTFNYIAGRPHAPEGTRWDEAKQQLQPLWPVMASSDFVNWGTAKRVAYFWKDGAVQQDEAYDPAKGFRLYLQQREAGWMPQDGEHINVSVTDLLYGSGGGAVDTRGLGPGLACYTPEALDRCAVLSAWHDDPCRDHGLLPQFRCLPSRAAASARTDHGCL